MLLSRRRAALDLLLAVKLAGCAEEAPRDRPSPVPIKGSTNEASGYTGSKLCRTCHPDIYEAWTSSRHSYSILTASQARAAGYPLVVFYIESRRFLIRDSPRPATTYEQKTGGADGVKGA